MSRECLIIIFQKNTFLHFRGYQSSFSTNTNANYYTESFKNRIETRIIIKVKEDVGILIRNNLILQ